LLLFAVNRGVETSVNQDGKTIESHRHPNPTTNPNPKFLKQLFGDSPIPQGQHWPARWQD